jgi:hypothetical protein
LTLVAAGLALAGVACGGTFQTGPDSGGDDSATDSGEPGDGGYHNDVDNPEIGPGDGDHPDSPLPDAPSGDVGPGDTGPGDTGPGLDVVLPDVIAIDVITPFDVAAPPDATSTCSIMGGFGGGGPGTCSVGTDYTCGADTYEIECDCPSGTCTCQKDGAPIPVAVSYKGCPSCSKMPFAMVAAACGIPY